uniref:C-type lectin domain-containing protein n=1 Tax=Esox lucius TaxID=8010 RepID=A0A3P9AQC6_ESOLU
VTKAWINFSASVFDRKFLIFAIYNNLTKERDQLQTSYNNLTKERDKLQTRYYNLIKERDQLQGSYKNLTHYLCPQSWIKNGSSCYYISTVLKSWTDSRQDCLDRGGDLVIINSREEQALIKSFSYRAWIGLSEDIKKSWRWVDGSPLTTSYWNSGEPNNMGGTEDCVEILIVHKDLFLAWNDASCKDPKHWICERLLYSFRK